MTAFFDYPKAAQFGKPVPKSKLYDHGRASKKLRQLFVDQVDQIVWTAKLAPETTNLTATKAVAEVQVFTIKLRVPEIDEAILSAIDKAIPYPIIFELSHDGKRKAIAAYKRANEADAAKWVVSEYFGSEWEAEDEPRTKLPTALNLGALYDKLLTALMPHEARTDEPIATRVERVEAVRAKTREVERIKSRLLREKQYNKRLAINAELRDAAKQLNTLSHTKAVKD